MILDALVALALEPAADHVPQPSRSAPSAAVKFLRCVIGHESLHAGLAKAENPRSTASGLFQVLDSTWATWAKHVPGASKWHHASHAPASVQWDVALGAVARGGRRAWHGTGCEGS